MILEKTCNLSNRFAEFAAHVLASLRVMMMIEPKKVLSVFSKAKLT